MTAIRKLNIGDVVRSVAFLLVPLLRISTPLLHVSGIVYTVVHVYRRFEHALWSDLVWRTKLLLDTDAFCYALFASASVRTMRSRDNTDVLQLRICFLVFIIFRGFLGTPSFAATKRPLMRHTAAYSLTLAYLVPTYLCLVLFPRARFDSCPVVLPMPDRTCGSQSCVGTLVLCEVIAILSASTYWFAMQQQTT